MDLVFLVFKSGHGGLVQFFTMASKHLLLVTTMAARYRYDIGMGGHISSLSI